jgi:hypothetical protein
LIECVDDVVGGSHDVAFAGTLRRPVFVRVMGARLAPRPVDAVKSSPA